MAPQLKDKAIPSLARIRQLTLGIFLSAGLLIGLKLFTIFEAPSPQPDQGQTHPAFAIAETLLGPNKVRLTEASGETILLVDGDDTLGASIEGQIKAILKESGSSETFSVEAYPFASGLAAGIRNEDLAMLLILGLIAASAGWVNFQLMNLKPAFDTALSPTPPAIPDHPEKSDVSGPTLDQIKDIAAKDPGQVARAIHAWMAKESV